MGRWRWAALGVVAQLACGSVSPPAATPVTESSLDKATAVVLEEVARDPNFQLVEGGLSVEAYQWSWRERVVVEPMVVGPVVTLATPHSVRERVLVGPAHYYVPFRDLTGVAVRRWAIGASVELSVDGEAEPILVHMDDAATAQRLADALDLLRRARHGEKPDEKDPPSPSAGE